MKFYLNARMTISVSTVVEAESLSEAINIAKDRENMSIPPNNGYPESEYWVADELDGLPEDISNEQMN